MSDAKREPCAQRKSAKPDGLTLFLKYWLLLVATLVTSLTKQLAVLLLRHTLAALLDY